MTNQNDSKQEKNLEGKKYIKDTHTSYEGGSLDIVRRNVAEAIRIIYGHDRLIEEVKVEMGQVIHYAPGATYTVSMRDSEAIRELTEILGDVFPKGTRYFVVHSTSSTCEHEPKCEWWDGVYHYRDRSVVIDLRRAREISIGEILERLTAK